MASAFSYKPCIFSYKPCIFSSPAGKNARKPALQIQKKRSQTASLTSVVQRYNIFRPKANCVKIHGGRNEPDGRKGKTVSASFAHSDKSRNFVACMYSAPVRGTRATITGNKKTHDMKIEQQLAADIRAAINTLYGQDVSEQELQLQKTKREFEGHLTLVVFPLLRVSRKKPEDTAREIGEHLMANSDVVSAFNVVKGFLNLTVAAARWVELLGSIDTDPEYGLTRPTEASPLVMIEYSSPNTNKPLHLGHVRNNLLGWSLAQIMEANGNRVVKTNIVNDRGIHICKSMLAWLKYGCIIFSRQQI